MRSALFSLAALLAVHSQAATLDQFVDPPQGTGSAGHFIGRGESYAQTFTVGYDGLLTSIDLYVFGSESMGQPLLFDLRSTLNGKPAESLERVTLQAASVPRYSELPGGVGTRNSWGGSWLSVDVEDIEVTTGQQFAVSLDAASTGTYNFYRWLLPSPTHISEPAIEPYRGGGLWYDEGGGWQLAFGSTDFAFRTYVNRPVDVNLDGRVDGVDLGAIVADDFEGVRFLEWQRGYSVAVASAVPEPAGVVLLVVGCVFALCKRKSPAEAVTWAGR